MSTSAMSSAESSAHCGEPWERIRDKVIVVVPAQKHMTLYLIP